MTKVHKDIQHCRICGSSDLTEVVSIEEQHLSPTFVVTNENNPLSDIRVPQTLVLCDRSNNANACGLLQLKETVEPDYLYREYFYRSAVSDTMRKDLKNVVDDVISRVELEKNDVVIDIGANDCTMIGYFSSNLVRIGVEPAQNIVWTDVEPSIRIVNDYFSQDVLGDVLGERKVKVFTSCAMFYDLDDPNSFVADVRSLLHREGVWCIQLSYLPLMLKNINFYDICNEHLEYYSLHTLNYLMKQNGLEIFDAAENDVNGGSVRVMITHLNRKIEKTDSFKELIDIEKQMNLFDKQTYIDFHEKILNLKTKIKNTIGVEIKNGNTVLGLGASTKGNMLLQLFGIGKETIPYISERNPEKVGLKTLGTDIELISEERARELNPSYMLVLPWYFKNEIVDREREYILNGGKLLFPMPYPHVVHKDGETKL
jgi:NDP-4-keto-2,6-dideoxyhexose 3-C-methyltransferase